ncbi:GNAT family N-acetyltransferase, partial [Caldivirga sp. UBA161]|uniref:GNAT family N-acetyltransferase n=1 Tax=Caldivirga sp. UBA161 TaxID=1915569 RepID=UPI0025B8BD95
SIMLYPSLAFEVNDTSPLFFSNNTAFALEFEMGDEPSNVGNWPLYYSISNDTLTCSGIWGSSGVGSMWPIGSESWGASGLTIKYPSEPVSYDAIIGSISKMKNNIIINTVGITCSSKGEPPARRRGIGKALTEHAINEALKSGARYAMLMVVEWNNVSRRLAESLGFQGVLMLHAGVANPSEVKVLHGEEARGLVREALRRSNGYFCTMRGIHHI